MRITTKTEISAYPLLSRGKVRDIYDIDDKTLLIVTTDRMSAFDVIMDKPIPYKGVILNQITLFWMDKFKDIIPNHLVESDVDRFPAALAPWKDELEGRAVLVRKAKPLPVECIVRGYISGSGWKDYQKTGTLCGYQLPAGMRESDKLETALFTPSTKAELGQHDQNISADEAARLLDEAGWTVGSDGIRVKDAVAVGCIQNDGASVAVVQKILAHLHDARDVHCPGNDGGMALAAALGGDEAEDAARRDAEQIGGRQGSPDDPAPAIRGGGWSGC